MTNIELEAASNAAQADATQALVETAALRVPSFVVVDPSATLSNERVLTQGTNIQLQDGGAGGNVTIILAVGDLTGINKAMTIRPAAPSGTEDGGTLTLHAQDASGAIYNGGGISVGAGNGGASAVGGSVSISAGFGDTGGPVSISAGPSSGTGQGGDVQISAGTSSTNGGSVNLYAGSGDAGGQFYFTSGSGVSTGGAFNAVAGDASGFAGVGGSVFLASGNATAGGGSSAGDVFIASGAGESKGGDITIQSGLSASYAVKITDDGANSLVGLHGASPVAQSTGWSSPTGTATKTAFNTATVTTAQLAERVKALLDYLIARGDIGP